MKKTSCLYGRFKLIIKTTETQKISNCFGFTYIGLMFYGPGYM